MTDREHTKAGLLLRDGTLTVVRNWRGAVASVHPQPRPSQTGDGVELFIAVLDDGSVIGFNGHVDLGTGIRTALAQIVAEELDVELAQVTMVLGHTEDAPDQGATIASETIQVAAEPLRRAAATARAHLVKRAAERLDVRPADLVVDGGMVRSTDTNRSVSYSELLAGTRERLVLDEEVPLKAGSSYRVVGRSVPRTDIPAKASGDFVYVHDVTVPDMVHGRVVRPPYSGLDGGDLIGRSFVSVDDSEVRQMPGVLDVVVIRDFVGVVAEREEQAAAAAKALRVKWRWSEGESLNLGSPEAAVRAQASTPRCLLDRGNVDAAAAASKPMNRTYVWPYQMHGSIGPSCAVADWRDDGLVVWSGTQNPHPLRIDLSVLLNLDADRIEIRRHEAAGCYGRNCADDVGADAALLSRAVRRPVRVQLTREQEHLWEPKGAAQVMDVKGGIATDGVVAAYDFSTRYPSNGSPTLALLLTGAVPVVPLVFEMGDRTAIPPYDYDNVRVTVHDMAPIVRASWFRGVSALPNTFAHESWIDECAVEAGVDPIEYRLRYLPDQRAADLTRKVAERAGWQPHTAPKTHGGDGNILRGRGFAQALYVHGKFPGKPAAWSAWVADVEVNQRTGEVAVTRVTVGQDTGMVVNPAGVRHQIHGNVIQSTSRTLMEKVAFEASVVASRDWGTYPILSFMDVPAIDVIQVNRPDCPPLGAGESASVPSAAAIANAIFDATGVRFRELPFTPDRILDGLGHRQVGTQNDHVGRGLKSPAQKVRTKKRSLALLASSAITGALGMATALLPAGALAPIQRPDPGLYSAATVERGRLVAAAGDCVVCHTGPKGELAGGLGLDTPFGRVWSSNITPDVATGIGSWSYAAFERAMRAGVSRTGHHLYPAHPYTSFARTNDADLEALYAYLMTQPAVTNTPPETRLAFPFNMRGLMAGWNALFHRAMPFEPRTDHSEEWNRGAYLVEGLGHCSACHTPRNLFGAERGGSHLAGAFVEGWEAPALSELSHAPVPWTKQAFFDFLRTGFSPLHGVAAGPMAAVVTELGKLPDADLHAMATYLSSLSENASGLDEASTAAAVEAAAQGTPAGMEAGARIYQGSCAVCHEQGTGPRLFGVKPSLALNSGLHSTSPDNLLKVVLHGIMSPAHSDLGYMPGFKDHFTDDQVADLVTYLRARFARSEPPWRSVREAAARARSH